MMITKLKQFVSSVTLVMALSVSTVNAHHSFAMYDSDKVVTLEGTIKEFQWTNPHAILKVTSGADGQVWTLELTAPGQLTRNGWTHSTLKAGDAIKVQLHPFRDGRLGGSYMTATVNGQEISR